MPLAYVDRVWYHVARADLLSLLRPEVEEFFVLVDLLLPNGSSLPHRKALIPKDPSRIVDMRGANGFCWRCPVCKTVYYNIASSCDRTYFVRSQIPAEVFSLRTGELAISEHVHKRIRSRQWAKMEMHPLPVLDEPLDGYPATLENTPEEAERIPPWELEQYERHREFYLRAMEQYKRMKREGLV